MNTVVHYYGLTRIRVKYCTRDDPEYLCHALRYFTFVSFTLNYMASFYNQRPCNYTFCSFYLELFTCTHIRSIDTLSTFKRHLKFHLFQSASTVRMYVCMCVCVWRLHNVQYTVGLVIAKYCMHRYNFIYCVVKCIQARVL